MIRRHLRRAPAPLAAGVTALVAASVGLCSTPIAAAAPGPIPIDADGEYVVGADILPGVYTTAGPADGGSCYWKRVGPDDVILQNALTKQPQTVAIAATDVAFKTNGCQPWQLSDAPAPPDPTPPWLSQLKLRHSLDILNGLAGQSGNGTLPPY